MSTAIFYHPGCRVCLEAEQRVVEAIDRSKYQVEIVERKSAILKMWLLPANALNRDR